MLFPFPNLYTTLKIFTKPTHPKLNTFRLKNKTINQNKTPYVNCYAIKVLLKRYGQKDISY